MLDTRYDMAYIYSISTTNRLRALMGEAKMNARAELQTYSQKMEADIAKIRADYTGPVEMKHAYLAGAFEALAEMAAHDADTEAAICQRDKITTLTKFEGQNPVRALEWDEVHDFCDYLKAGLAMRYGECDEMENVRHCFKKLQADLCELENMLGATDALDAWTDARIKAEKEAA